MFEQAVLSHGPASKRVWTTFAGVTGQALMVTFAVMVPMIWPEAMPSVKTLTGVFAPPSPPSRPIEETAAPWITHAIAKQYNQGVLTLPRNIPVDVRILVDPPPDVGGESGVAGAVPGSDTAGVPGALWSDIVRQAIPAFVPPRPAETARPAPATAEPVAPPRYKVGGLVKLGPLIHRVEPRYPPLAIAARISGEVVLQGVVGIDGRIHELKLIKGHPLLTPAAIDAVRQWIYQPTTLNGEPVEVIAPITVTFRLN